MSSDRASPVPEAADLRPAERHRRHSSRLGPVRGCGAIPRAGIISTRVAAGGAARARPAALMHGAIEAYFLVHTTSIRVQTVLLHPYTRTDCTTPSVQLYRWDDPFRTGVQPRRVDTHSYTARITQDVQL